MDKPIVYYLPEWFRVLGYRQSDVSRAAHINRRHLSKLCSKTTRHLHSISVPTIDRIVKAIGVSKETLLYNPKKHPDLVNKVLHDRIGAKPGTTKNIDLAELLQYPNIVYEGKPVSPKFRAQLKKVCESVVNEQLRPPRK